MSKSKQDHTTAILVFANSSQEELKHKTIINGNVLFNELTAHTLKTVEKSKLPYFHISEKEQIGTCFGERFINAIQAIFDKGYEKVITIGNDSPQLKVGHILEASNQLDARKFVLGPSVDGGFYLMGIHKSQFNASIFKKLAWQTSNLSKQILRLIAISAIETVQLQTLYDIDTVNDIKQVITFAYQIPKKVLVILLSILESKESTPTEYYSFLPHLHFRTYHNKGSPVVFPS